MSRKQNIVLKAGYIVYLLILAWVILCHGTFETFNSVFDPDFRSLNFYFYFNGMESILNMLIFVPVGLYLSVLFEKSALFKKIAMVVAASVFFEIVQYVLAVGATDIMDVINNTVGGCVGIAVGLSAMKLLKERFFKIAVPLAAVGTAIIAVIAFLMPLR